MKSTKWCFLLFLCTCCILNALAQPAAAPKREFRAVWVATVENIDWPSKRGLPVDVQQQELIGILNEHQKTGINAILFQIRPAADAFYAKSREPWSIFLSGKQGVAPQPLYDPLQFAIEEAHKRAMELHAWINPYRAANDLVDSNISSNHITRLHPEWFFTYGSKKYFNPGLPEVRKYIISVVMDVVHNYDIDGIHFDDYFYPYPEKEKLPDTTTYVLYGQGFANIDDWRRHNVDTLIHVLADSIHAAKSYVKFGISPFGIWRNLKDDPNGSESTGFSGYSSLYADARKWTQYSGIDYINPQLYFPFYYKAAPFEKLLDWWSKNSFNKHVYIGQGVYRAMEKREGWRDIQQLSNQMREIRKNPRVQGSVFFSSKSLTTNLGGFQDSLRTEFYQYPALPPPMIWLGESSPRPPDVFHASYLNNQVDLKWAYSLKQPKEVYGYVIYRFKKEEKINLDHPENIIHVSYDESLRSYTDTTAAEGTSYKYVITAIDRLKNEGLPSETVQLIIK